MQRRRPKIIKGKQHWLCPTCKRWVSKDKYFNHPRSWNGIGAQCKTCHTKSAIRTRSVETTRRINRESMRRQRLVDPEKFRKRERIFSKRRIKDLKYKARVILNGAVVSGKLKKPARCNECGASGKIYGHHPNYKRPLFVEWLCSLCHGKKHRILKERRP